MAFFNINNNEVVKLTNKLEKMHRSALPVAVRGTLNSAAFDVKKRTLGITSDAAFTKRKKTFFRANSNSRAKKAVGFNVKTMKSEAGMIKGKSQANEDMEQQEKGGKIKGRSFIPIDSGRISNNHDKNVRGVSKMANIQFGSVRRIKKGGAKSKSNFMKTVAKLGKGRYLIYEKTLFLIEQVKSGRMKLKALHSFKTNRTVQVKPTRFVEKAGRISGRNMQKFFNIEAAKQIKRLKNK